MAGYNGRTSQSNATTSNDQMIRQRKAINETTSQGISDDALNNENVAGYGIAKSQAALFSGPTSEEIISGSFNLFLEEVAASSNPDFHTRFKPDTFRSNDQIINNAKARRNDALDRPAIGSGPNLKAQDINKVIQGTIVEEETVGTGLEGGRGFGVRDPEDKSLVMGSYFKERYSINSDDPSSTVTKGERDSVPDDPYNYKQ